jgi:hypothetical protein
MVLSIGSVKLMRGLQIAKKMIFDIIEAQNGLNMSSKAFLNKKQVLLL